MGGDLTDPTIYGAQCFEPGYDCAHAVAVDMATSALVHTNSGLGNWYLDVPPVSGSVTITGTDWTSSSTRIVIRCGPTCGGATLRAILRPLAPSITFGAAAGDHVYAVISDTAGTASTTLTRT